jgi:hypothetical protein
MDASNLYYGDEQFGGDFHDAWKDKRSRQKRKLEDQIWMENYVKQHAISNPANEGHPEGEGNE